MCNHSTPWAACVLLLLLAAPSSGQDPIDSVPPFETAEGIPITSRAAGFAATPEGPLAIGPDYKAWFDDAGLHFVPALGPDAPRTRSLGLALRGVSRGGVPVASLPERTALHRLQDARRAERAHAEGIVERFEATPRGLEHALCIERRPHGSGDLVVAFDLETDLVAAEPPGSAALYFEARAAGKALGGVTIGGLTGIDAAGRRCAGTVREVAGTIEWVLPASFVERATYPILLDPLLGTHFSALGAGTQGRAGVGGYERLHAAYLVAWEQSYSAFDTDVYAQRLRTSGVLNGPPIAVATSRTAHEFAPRIAAARPSGHLLVTWLEGDHGWIKVPRRIVCRAVSMRDGTPGPSRQVVDARDEEIAKMRLVGERSTVDDEVFVVFTRRPDDFGAVDLGLASVTVSTSGTVTPSVVVTVATDVYPDFQVSDCIGNGGRWMLAWQEGGQQTIRLFLFDRDYITLQQSMVGGELVGLTGNGDSFLLSYTIDNPFSGRTSHYRRMRWTGSMLDLGTEQVRRWQSRDPAWFHTKVLTSSSSSGPGPFDLLVGFAPLALDGSGPCGTTQTFGPANRRNVFTDFAARWSYGADGDDVGLLVFESTDPNPPFATDVRVQRIDALGNGGPITNRGGGCGVAGTFTTSGPWALGAPDFRFQLQGSGGSLAILNVALGANPATIPCGTCVLMPADVQLASAPITSGSARFETSVFCDPALLGSELSAQWLVMTAGSSPCPLVAGIAVSDRLVLRLGE